MSSHLTPLQVCERLIAPLSQLGMIVGENPKAAYTWQSSSKWRDAGDMSPRANRRALAYAKANGIPLTADHLINGAARDEIEDLVRAMRDASASKDQPKVAAE